MTLGPGFLTKHEEINKIGPIASNNTLTKSAHIGFPVNQMSTPCCVAYQI